MPETPDDATARLRDIEAIKVVKSRYFRFMDEKDWPAMRALLADDLEFHHPTIGSFTDADATIAAVGERVAAIRSVHQGHDPEVTVHGDDADGLWGLQSFVSSPTDPSVQITRFARYTDRFRRIDGSWKISYIHFAYLWDSAAA